MKPRKEFRRWGHLVVLGTVGLVSALFVLERHGVERQDDRSHAPETVQRNAIHPVTATRLAAQAAQVAELPAAADRSTGFESTTRIEVPPSSESPHHISGRADSQKSCSHAGAADPKTQMELDLLLGEYLGRCSDRLFSALDEIYQNEGRDEGWATKLEQRLEQSARESSTVQIKGACHESLCRFDLDAADCARTVREFRAVEDSVRNTDLSVSLIWRSSPTCTKYIYSTVLPPAFLKPLRQIMDGTS